MRVIIVGAGPAGLISALFLLQRGVNPLIVEKSSDIISTPCGEGCDLQSLNDLPFDSSPYIENYVKGVKMNFPGDSVYYVNKETVTLDRTGWLKGIAEEAQQRGAEIRLDSSVTSIDDSSITLKSGARLEYDVLIGADGPNSVIAQHIGVSHSYLTASQYRIAFDTAGMEYLEVYFDKTFSIGYSWVFPKNGIINVGTGSDFRHLDEFLRYKGLDNYEIVRKEAGIIPYSGMKRLVNENIALIGDSASMPNPTSLGGLTPIIHAARLLSSNIDNLNNYEDKIRNHPLANNVLLKASHALAEFNNDDLTNVGKLLVDAQKSDKSPPSPADIAKYPSLFLKLDKLRAIYQAGRIAIEYGW